eukprot:CAMPEP_0185582518 /NCGR_PEP_ID=MMETSP0434-20130131/20881_1 /TAXON_ID=626734 ORGANISM="Favella taraikaensis, Strain Fe Narragansett Bay" /NCGR_SAMPLE_ID=MMETSP0434 /ASSEMBLY_ACC=CAM_ASM_000379 /LENGTH=42 /DNA_ID= /DNA_START= /DNA_END= /DNA_ORIENTATION=
MATNETIESAGEFEDDEDDAEDAAPELTLQLDQEEVVTTSSS